MENLQPEEQKVEQAPVQEDVNWGRFALDIIETEPQHVQNLWDNAEYMRKGFKEMGYNTATSNTPIIPVSSISMKSMYSRTRLVMCQLAKTEIGIRKVVSRTSQMLKPSTPTW